MVKTSPRRAGFAHRFSWLVCALASWGMLVAGAREAQAQPLNLNRRYPFLEAENNVWIGTPQGLFQYNPADDAFRRLTLPAEAAGGGVHEIHYSDEWLWCVLDSGLAALHIRSNEWLYYDDEAGLPSGRLNGLAFYEDYVWVATDGGAARFDVLIEEWETYDQTAGLPESDVNDVVAGAERVWLVTDRHLSEYDPQFEKWRHFDLGPDRPETFRRGFLLGEEVWLVSGRGLTRFDTELQTQQDFHQAALSGANLLELVIEDEAMWAVTTMGLYRYDKTSEVWQEFEGNAYLAGSTPVNAFVDGSDIWVLTTESVMVWEGDEKAWEILDYASGLSGSGYEGGYASGDMAFLIGPRGLDYEAGNDTWRSHDIDIREGRLRSGGRVLGDLFDNPEGGFVEIGSRRWGWDGTRITLVEDYERRLEDDGNEGEGIVSSRRLDVKSQLDLGGGRGLTGFYNDVDYSETMYGAGYRGRADDILRELRWGDFRREPGSIPFGESSSLFGTDVWLQAGAKTERYKRSMLTLRGQYAERRSRKTYESFHGASTVFETTLRDVDYARDEFYALPGLSEGRVPEMLEVYVDDLDAGSNTPNTLEHRTIAGVTGDFDLMKATEDYFFYARGNSIRLGGVAPSWTIVVRFLGEGVPHEEVLQQAGLASTARTNFYSLRGEGILPHSFDLSITDSLGAEVRLADFGIDSDDDGFVDSDWLDYAAGVLFFPNAEPFPPEVYDPEAPRSFYRMQVSYETELSLIRLAERDLVRGTEVLALDGRIAERGNDYVLDYTNGTLVFVREGVVNADTRIEVEYEYYDPAETDQMMGAMLNFSPSDDFYLQGDWIRLGREAPEGAAGDSVSNLLSLHSEMRRAVGGYDVKLVPGFAYDPGASEITGSSVDGLISSSQVRLEARYESYDERYNNLYRPQSVVGEVKDRFEIFTTADLTRDLRLTGDWSRARGFAGQTEAEPADRSGSVSALLHRRNWPGWEITYRSFGSSDETGRTDRYFVENRLDYKVPAGVSRKILIESFRAEAVLRTGKQTGQGETDGEQEFRRGQVRLTTSVSDRFQVGFFYRRNDLEDGPPGGMSPASRSERVLVNVSHEEWRLLQVNLRVENSLDQGFHRGSAVKDVNLDQFSQINLRLSPGLLWNRLSSHYLEFNVARTTTDASCATGGSVGGWLWRAIGTNAACRQEADMSRTYSVKSEYRPGSDWYVLSLFERNRSNAYRGESTLEASDWLWTERVEAKLGFRTRLRLQYRQFLQDKGYERVYRYFEPSAWVEHRWTPDLQNILNLTYRRQHGDEAKIRDASHVWDARYDLILRKERVLGLRRLEIRQSLSGRHTRTTGYNPERALLLTSGSALDLYPLHSVILRFRLDLSRYLDRLVEGNDYTDVAFSLRTSLKF